MNISINNNIYIFLPYCLPTHTHARVHVCARDRAIKKSKSYSHSHRAILSCFQTVANFNGSSPAIPAGDGAGNSRGFDDSLFSSAEIFQGCQRAAPGRHVRPSYDRRGENATWGNGCAPLRAPGVAETEIAP
jgi:hypothetical protein